MYEKNGTYTTSFISKNGKEEKLTFIINEIDQTSSKISIKKTYDSKTNTIIISATSNNKLDKTKPTWILSSDKKTYSKVYNKNGTYTTTFTDIYGNEEKVSFTINEINNIYITKTGKHYHFNGNCNGGTYYITTESIKELEKRGITPCNKCVV